MTGPADVFDRERPRLLGLAYRVLGSLADAEDAVQEAWLRWSATDQAAVERPAAWLTTVTTRLALDRLRSAQHRRETYVGPWLPEPVQLSPSVEDAAEVAESLTIAFLAVLEELDPVSRVVFVLADVFDVPFDEVAVTVGRTPAACRQLATRARRKVRSAPLRRPAGSAQGVVDRLLAAVVSGDIDATMALLADDVTLVSDGGAATRAARRPVVGPQRVARLLVNLAKRGSPEARIRRASFNGSPGVWIEDPSIGDTVVALDVTGGAAWRIWVVRAPDKLPRPHPVNLG